MWNGIFVRRQSTGQELVLNFSATWEDKRIFLDRNIPTCSYGPDNF